MAESVLVVDDDPIIRNLVAALVRRRGMVPAQAANGEEAITLLRQSSYSSIVLDMMMPKSSGWDVLTFVEREKPELMSRLIVVSAAGEDALKSSATRCRCVLHKPFNADELYAALALCGAEPDAEVTIRDASSAPNRNM